MVWLASRKFRFRSLFQPLRMGQWHACKSKGKVESEQFILIITRLLYNTDCLAIEHSHTSCSSIHTHHLSEETNQVEVLENCAVHNMSHGDHSHHGGMNENTTMSMHTTTAKMSHNMDHHGGNTHQGGHGETAGHAVSCAVNLNISLKWCKLNP